MEVTRAGGAIGIPGLYVTEDPGGIDEAAKRGSLSIRLGLGWAKSHVFITGQCPVMRYNRQLMMAILHDKVQIAKAVNVEVIPLSEALRGYRDFDQGAAKKFALDPHGLIGTASLRPMRIRVGNDGPVYDWQEDWADFQSRRRRAPAGPSTVLP